ncbi:MAG: pilin [Parcubacteria group bacterium]
MNRKKINLYFFESVVFSVVVCLIFISIAQASSAATGPCVGKSAGDSCQLSTPVNGSTVGECGGANSLCWPVASGASTEPTPTDEAVNDFLHPDTSLSNAPSTPTEDAVNNFLPSSTSTTSSGENSFLPSSTSETAPEGVHIPTGAETGLSDVSIKALLTSLLRWLLGIVGVVALIGFVISGIQYIISSGNEEMAKTAKQNMVNSIIGIVVVLASLVVIQAIDYALRGYSVF